MLSCVSDGELYTGTVADYRGNRPVISRHLSEGKRVDLKLDDTLGWLEGECSEFFPNLRYLNFFNIRYVYGVLDQYQSICLLAHLVCYLLCGGNHKHCNKCFLFLFNY